MLGHNLISPASTAAREKMNLAPGFDLHCTGACSVGRRELTHQLSDPPSRAPALCSLLQCDLQDTVINIKAEGTLDITQVRSIPFMDQESKPRERNKGL